MSARGGRATQQWVSASYRRTPAASKIGLSGFAASSQRAARSRFYSPLACINLASPTGVASGGAPPRLIKAEESATNEPDSRW
jgi:hypothetical protein